MKAKNSRLGVISWLAYIHGGHNAGRGDGFGRLGMCVDVTDDEAVARYFHDSIESETRKEAEKTIVKLKAKIFDLEHKE